MSLLDDTLFQNRQVDTGNYPYGVPSNYSWYASGGNGTRRGFYDAPAGFTSLTGWSTVYPKVGAPNPPAGAKIIIGDWRVFVHLKTGGWIKVQDQATMGIGGGYFQAAISPENLGATGSVITNNVDGTKSISAPQQGIMTHFWPGSRASFNADTVNAVFCIMTMKVNMPDAHLITQCAADWWASPTAPFVSTFANNPGIGSTDWFDLTTTYKTFCFCHLSLAEILSDPPPPLAGLIVQPPVIVPPVVVPPVVIPPVITDSGAMSVLFCTAMSMHTVGAVQGDFYNLWSNGTLSENVSFPIAGTYNVKVEAKGSVAGTVWPLMQVLVDDKVVATTTVNSATVTSYNYNLTMTAGVHKIGVGFTNDANVGAEDRNLYLKRIVIFAPVATPPAPPVIPPVVIPPVPPVPPVVIPPVPPVPPVVIPPVVPPVTPPTNIGGTMTVMIKGEPYLITINVVPITTRA